MSSKRVYSPPLLKDGDNNDKWLRETVLWKYLTDFIFKRKDGCLTYFYYLKFVRLVMISVSSLNNNDLKLDCEQLHNQIKHY